MSDKEQTQNTDHTDDLQQIFDFLKQHGMTLAAGLILVIAISVGLVLYKTSKARETAQVAKSLFSARSQQDLENIISQYPSSPYAPVALLRVAKNLYDTGNYDAAMVKYTEFREKYPNHELAAAAELNKIYCIEARGQIEEALSGYESFAKQNSSYFMTPQAVFGQARCKVLLGKPVDAKAIYEDFIAAHPKSPWVSRAEYLLRELNTKMGVEAELKSGEKAKTEVQTSKIKAAARPRQAPVKE
jgi:outer membrane protein assembly factor BamD (BamD/ComL family)